MTTIIIFLKKIEKTEKCLKLPDLARKLIRKLFWNYFTPPPPDFFFEKKNEKCLEFPDLARKLVGKIFWKFYPPQDFFFWKKRKVLRIAWFGEKVDQNFCLKILHPPPGYSADTCAEKFPLTSRGGWAEGLACADPGARTPIGASGNFSIILFPENLLVALLS